MTIRSGTPADLEPDDRAAFIALVSGAGEVNRATLPGLVDNAIMLVMLFDHDCLIGTAAIKAPLPAHQAGEFIKAGAPEKASLFPLELGWVVVHPDHRGRGCARELVNHAVATTAHCGIYATTKTQQMTAILRECGFETVGAPYPSVMNPDVNLTLFARPSSA